MKSSYKYDIINSKIKIRVRFYGLDGNLIKDGATVINKFKFYEVIMASSKEYIEFVLEQCNGLSARAMMGEYVLYYGGKVVGGVYDNRLLVKPTKSALSLMPNAPKELPYEGAKEMLLVEDVEDGELLQTLFEAMYAELPEARKKK